MYAAIFVLLLIIHNIYSVYISPPHLYPLANQFISKVLITFTCYSIVPNIRMYYTLDHSIPDIHSMIVPISKVVEFNKTGIYYLIVINDKFII